MYQTPAYHMLTYNLKAHVYHNFLHLSHLPCTFRRKTTSIKIFPCILCTISYYTISMFFTNPKGSSLYTVSYCGNIIAFTFKAYPGIISYTLTIFSSVYNIAIFIISGKLERYTYPPFPISFA